MAERSDSADAIVEAAQRLIRTRGPGRLRLSAVAGAAGVSRQTLYRWFPTKEDLLGAITERELDVFNRGLEAALAGLRAPARRLEVAVRYLVTYLDESMSAEVIDVDPAFALGSLAAALKPQAETFVRVVGEALDETPAVTSSSITRDEAADLLLRLAYSHYLAPHPDPERLLAVIRALAGLRPGRRRS